MIDENRKIAILIPVYEDWESFALLIEAIDRELHSERLQVEILAVDDGSFTSAPTTLSLSGESISTVSVLPLKTNLGHQRAIALGLSYLFHQRSADEVIVMDGDGEDRPEDIRKLIQTAREHEGQKVVFAQRARRSESQTFRRLYSLYRFIFRILTGRQIRFGNFSLIPRSQLGRVIWLADIWNNYAAAVVKARVPFTVVPCDRGIRFAGQSKMNLVGLIVHGLSSISVYNDVVGARLLVVSTITMVLALTLASVATVVKFTTDLAIPGWATYAVGLSLLGVLQALSLSAFFVFLILHGRNHNSFVPGRDYASFLGAEKVIFRAISVQPHE